MDKADELQSRQLRSLVRKNGELELWPFLQKIGPAAPQKLRERIATELKTTFASHYAKEISLAKALRLDEIAVYHQRTTGATYLINPNRGIAA